MFHLLTLVVSRLRYFVITFFNPFNASGALVRVRVAGAGAGRVMGKTCPGVALVQRGVHTRHTSSSSVLMRLMVEMLLRHRDELGSFD